MRRKRGTTACKGVQMNPWSRHFSRTMHPRRRLVAATVFLSASVMIGSALPARADDDDHGNGNGNGNGNGHNNKLLTCDDSMKAEFKPDSLTTVLLVKAYKKGDPLALSNT